MTTVIYDCRGDDGISKSVNSLKEAKDFVKKHGGSYKAEYLSTVSESEAYVISGHRVGGRQG